MKNKVAEALSQHPTGTPTLEQLRLLHDIAQLTDSSTPPQTLCFLYWGLMELS